jgi:hypothetical protein
MLLLNFCPAHYRNPLKQLPPWQWQIRWISKRWPPSSAESQRLLGGTSTGVFHPVVPIKFRKYIFAHFHNVLNSGGLPPIVLFHPGLCGADCPATSPPASASAWPASGARSTTTHAWLLSTSPFHNDVFLTFMLIWWDHCSTVMFLLHF